MCVQSTMHYYFLCSFKYLQYTVSPYASKRFGVGYCSSRTPPALVRFKWQTSSCVLIKCTHTDRPASIMDLPSSLGCNEWDLKQRRMVPASQTLNTQMAQIAYAAPETEDTEVVPEKVKITLNKTRQEGKNRKTICKICQSRWMTGGTSMEPTHRLKYHYWCRCVWERRLLATKTVKTPTNCSMQPQKLITTLPPYIVTHIAHHLL